MKKPTQVEEPVERVDVVLGKDFFGPDEVLYRRANDAGDVLVHSFPASWTLPKSAKLAKDAILEAGPPPTPQPRTFSEMQKAGLGGGLV